MKIGVDIRCLEEEPSGVSEYVTNLLTSILKTDQQNQYFLFFNSFNKNKEQLNKQFPFPNCHLVFFNIPNKIFNFSQTIFRHPQIDKMMNELDLFFMPNLNFAAFSRKIKTIITVHDLSFKYFPGFFSLKRRLWHSFVFPKHLFKKATQIIAVSDNTKKDLISQYNLPPEKIETIHSGINVIKKEMDDRIKKSIREKYQLADRYILSLSNIEPRKNIDSIIKAYQQVRRSGYSGQLVIGGKPSWSYSKIFKAAGSSDYKKDIRFLGYIDKEDKSYLYQLADLFCYPSFYEGFGFPPLESMICGTPVVTSSTTSLPEVVRNGAILVDPYNIREISKAMQVCLTDNKVRDKLIGAGEEVIKHYSWQKAAEQTISLFNQVNQTTCE